MMGYLLPYAKVSTSSESKLDRVKTWRKTSQELMPAHRQVVTDHYDIYPSYPLGGGQIHIGYDELAARICEQRVVVIDGFGGVFWENLRQALDVRLRPERGVRWINIADALRPEPAINERLAPFLGGDDPIFGRRFTGTLRDFFEPERLQALKPDPQTDVNILYGCGAALAGWEGLLIYVDVPKNEIQFRSRAGSITNLGARQPADPKAMYKRFYFVDWVALNRHKAALLPRIDWLVDEQRPDEPAMIAGRDLRAALTAVARSYVRARPWFEPGAWGGQWIKAKIPELPQDVPNYAWSFELISPENGIVFESDGKLLEVSFDTLMFQEHESVLGEYSRNFGVEFPIRFDFLDTFGGGNLSVQCHPSQQYIREQFGETFTQDETYYILDCGPQAVVYLGFRQGIDPYRFRTDLENSFRNGTAVDIERYVNTQVAHKHDLFLIPNGTIHCSGVNNLVLEISATPYIFTFKMYDWLRLDLDGKPRPINIDRAFDNLRFERQGERARRELVSVPRILEGGEGWRLVHIPTHVEHFYDVHRLEFSGSVAVSTLGSPHVLSLVEGEEVILELPEGRCPRFRYAETFVVPAATGRYRLVSPAGKPLKVVKAFLKAEWFAHPENAWLVQE